MSETLSESRIDLESDQNLAAAGTELANSIPREKTHEDLYDDTGALTTDGMIARAAVDRVPNPALRTEHENGLLTALDASRVNNIDIAREAAEKEAPHRDFAHSIDQHADSIVSGRSKIRPADKHAVLIEKRQKADSSSSTVRRIARKLTGRPEPSEQLTIDDVSDKETIDYLKRAAKIDRQRAYKAGDEVVQSYEK